MPRDMDLLLEQTQCDYWWLPSDVHIVRRDEITYTHSNRADKLFSNVVQLRSPAADHQRLVDEVLRAHMGGPSEWRLGTPSMIDDIESTLSDNGYHLNEECFACTTPVDTPRPPVPHGIEVRPIQTTDGIRDQFKVAARAFGRETRVGYSDEDLENLLADSTGPDARCHRFLAWDTATNEPVCAAAFNSYPDLGFGFLWGGGTVPEARGRGVYSAMLTARMRHAQRLGLTHVGLYAVTTTSAPILARQGFDNHGRLHMWFSDLEEA